MTKAIETPYWTVPLDHPAFGGHFPGTPILPGALLLDTALQTLAAATGIALEPCTISSLKFLSPAGPGDELAIDYRIAASGTIRFEIVAAGTAQAATNARRKIASGSIDPGQPA